MLYVIKKITVYITLGIQSFINYITPRPLSALHISIHVFSEEAGRYIEGGWVCYSFFKAALATIFIRKVLSLKVEKRLILCNSKTDTCTTYLKMISFEMN